MAINTEVQPWPPGRATDQVREMALQDEFDIYYTRHSKDQMADRNLLMGDVLHILKNGFIYEEPEAATREGCYKYQMECDTPNSGNRSVRIVIIPDAINSSVKVITVMWIDEH